MPKAVDYELHMDDAKLASMCSYIAAGVSTAANRDDAQNIVRELSEDAITEIDHASRKIIAGLIRGMNLWASDEDGIHSDAWPAYLAAQRYLNPAWVAPVENDNGFYPPE